MCKYYSLLLQMSRKIEGRTFILHLRDIMHSREDRRKRGQATLIKRKNGMNKKAERSGGILKDKILHFVQNDRLGDEIPRNDNIRYILGEKEFNED